MVSSSVSDAGSFFVLYDAVCVLLGFCDFSQALNLSCPHLPCSLSTNQTEPEMPEEDMVKIIQVITGADIPELAGGGFSHFCHTDKMPCRKGAREPDVVPCVCSLCSFVSYKSTFETLTLVTSTTSPGTL